MNKSSSGPIELKKDEVLFEDGASSAAMYVVKSGCIAILKKKGKHDIELARIMPGQLFGEMAFFDDRPRSAGAKAIKDSVVIALPFSALHSQFKQFPEWLKAMVRTVNDHLRDANKRIKELERNLGQDEEKFPPHTITMLCGIISLVANKFAEKEGEHMALSWNILRRYTIQIFQQATNKMESLLEVFVEKKLCDIEKIGEGRKKIKILNLNQIQEFTDFYNEYLFTPEEKRVSISRKEIPILKALIFYGQKEEKDSAGLVKISLDHIRQSSVKDLDYLVDIPDFETLIEKGFIEDKTQEEQGISTKYNLSELERICPLWELLFAIQDKDPNYKKNNEAN